MANVHVKGNIFCLKQEINQSCFLPLYDKTKIFGGANHDDLNFSKSVRTILLSQYFGLDESPTGFGMLLFWSEGIQSKILHYAILGRTKGDIFKSCPRVPKLGMGP